jgi:hypothetical protein
MRGLFNIDLSPRSWYVVVGPVEFIGRWQSAGESLWGYLREDGSLEVWLGRLYFGAERSRRSARRDHSDEASDDGAGTVVTSMATILPFPSPLKPADPLFRQGDTAEAGLVATTICR